MKDEIRLLPVGALTPDMDETKKLLGALPGMKEDAELQAFFDRESLRLRRYVHAKACAAVKQDRLFLTITLGEQLDRFLDKIDEEGDLYASAVLRSMADSCLFQAEKALYVPVRRLTREYGKGIACRAPETADSIKQAVKATEAESKIGVRLSGDGILFPTRTMALSYQLTDDGHVFRFAHDCRVCTSPDCGNKVFYLEAPEGRRIHFREEELRDRTVLEALREKGILLSAPCGGKGICGKCAVRLLKGEAAVEDEDSKIFSTRELEQGMRLACRCRPKGETEVLIAEQEEGFRSVGIDMKRERKGVSAAPIQNVGAAIDFGSTTIAGALVDLQDGKIYTTASSINTQRTFGADVISRIRAAQDGHLEELHACAAEDIAAILRKLLSAVPGSPEALRSVTIAGNTTMLHFLRGYSVKGLAAFPFAPVSLEAEELTLGKLLGKARLSGLPENTKAVLLPGISAYVGADIVSGLYALGLKKPDMRKGTLLFLDLGTNGEMALIRDGRILTASTAAGPALEGGNLSCGAGSVPGAIDRVRIDSSGRVHVHTIGGAAAKGLCGSGVIDCAAELYTSGLCDRRGTLKEPYFSKGVLLAEKTVMTQQDIREVQTAKAAIRAGICTLLKTERIKAEEVDRLYLAGGFGRYLDTERAGIIGLIPDALAEKTTAVGNTSLKGAVRLLTDPAGIESLKEIAGTAEETVLGNDEHFQELFLASIDFPIRDSKRGERRNTDDQR